MYVNTGIREHCGWLQMILRLFVDFSYDLLSPGGQYDLLKASVSCRFLANVQSCEISVGKKYTAVVLRGVATVIRAYEALGLSN